MSQGLRMVHLRTVPDAWHAKVLAARLGSEGILTHLQGNVSGPYPFGTVSVLVEAEQAELAAALLLADEVESAFSAHGPRPFGGAGDTGRVIVTGDGDGEYEAGDHDLDLTDGGPDGSGTNLDLRRPRKIWPRWQRAAAAAAAVMVAGAPVLAHFVGQ